MDDVYFINKKQIELLSVKPPQKKGGKKSYVWMDEPGSCVCVRVCVYVCVCVCVCVCVLSCKLAAKDSEEKLSQLSIALTVTGRGESVGGLRVVQRAAAQDLLEGVATLQLPSVRGS